MDVRVLTMRKWVPALVILAPTNISREPTRTRQGNYIFAPRQLRIAGGHLVIKLSRKDSNRTFLWYRTRQAVALRYAEVDK